ncbi:hypothetical protein C942_01540 [Photobacterium marinum]|uniref:Uncharacterized protein n=1 Tax=Photobacterium marinum TaxID=1056511 RepID=L8JFJ7_9GAMM|nr:hypothetical protein C942_01540 [Photobacterium marinum]
MSAVTNKQAAITMIMTDKLMAFINSKHYKIDIFYPIEQKSIL